MPTRYVDLVFIGALAVAQLVSSAIASFDGPLRAAIGLPFIVWAPGYAVTAAVWPCDRLPAIERFTISLGLSLSLAVLGGLALYATGFGLWPVPWAVLLGTPTLIGSLVAGWRRSRLRAWPSTDRASAAARLTRWPGLVLGVAAAAVSIVAAAVAIDGASQPREDFSQLWLLPVGSADSGVVEVGLHSQELQPATFHLRLLDGGSVALDTPNIQLTPGQTWTTTVHLDSGDVAPSGSSPVQALVYRSDAPDTPYRRTQLRSPQKGQ